MRVALDTIRSSWRMNERQLFSQTIYFLYDNNLLCPVCLGPLIALYPQATLRPAALPTWIRANKPKSAS